jgi:hypothetical protein
MSRILINNIIRQLNEIQDGSLWFDQCFRDKIDNLPDDDALTRPIPKIHHLGQIGVTIKLLNENKTAANVHVP